MKADLIKIIREELHKEASAIEWVSSQLEDHDLTQAFELLNSCRGKVVVTGMGKAGIIARKISATLASTGTTSIFLHAAEGIHGDLGMLARGDVVIAISNSGNTQELLSIIPFLKFLQVPIIAITGNPTSLLAENADVVLNCSIPKEYEQFGLVPTASTTVALAVGDALAVALLRHNDFRVEDFVRFHPGGTIGKKLLRVSDLMHQGDELPVVSENQPMSDALIVMTGKKLGCAAVIDQSGLLTGIITDGDLRRQLQSKGNNLLNFTAADCMTVSPKCGHANDLAVNTLNLMEQFHITMLPIIDDSGRPVGMLHMHDLITAGII